MGTTEAKLRAALESKNAIRAVLQQKYEDVTSDFSTYAGLIEPLADTSDATATADDILVGETAYVKGQKITGTALAGIPIVTTAGDGSAFTATVAGITELKVGTKITIIPHVNSASTSPSLNLNGLGAKTIRQRLSTNTSMTSVGVSATWLVKGKPVTLMYNGTYWVAELTRPDAGNIYGTVPIANGGTGATTLAAAKTNLGISTLETNYNAFEDDFASGLSTIASAITDMGINTAATASPTTMANNIREITHGIETVLIENYSEITGATMVSGYSEAGVTIEDDGSITISSPTNQGAEVIGATDNAFDLTDYKYAYIMLSQTTSSTYGKITVGFSTGKNTSYAVSESFANGEGNTGTHLYACMLDISNLTGNHYLCFNIPKHGYSSSANIKILMLHKK